MRSKQLFLYLFASLFIFAITACGYKPSAQYARKAMGEKISTSVHISSRDPENSVLIKDAIDSAIVESFHASLSTQEHSDTHLLISLSDPAYTPIVYDANGFVIGYRMGVILTITRRHNGLSKIYKSHGNYEFSVAPNAVVTDQERYNAIKEAAKKAMRSFVSQVAAEGTKSKY